MPAGYRWLSKNCSSLYVAPSWVSDSQNMYIARVHTMCRSIKMGVSQMSSGIMLAHTYMHVFRSLAGAVLNKNANHNLFYLLNKVDLYDSQKVLTASCTYNKAVGKD